MEWEGNIWSGRAINGVRGQYMEWEGNKWSERAIYGVRGQYMGWELYGVGAQYME